MSHGVNARQQNAFLSEHSPVETAKHPEIVLERRQTLTLDGFILLQSSFVILQFFILPQRFRAVFSIVAIHFQSCLAYS